MTLHETFNKHSVNGIFRINAAAAKDFPRFNQHRSLTHQRGYMELNGYTFNEKMESGVRVTFYTRTVSL